jgi:signal transduction histidine kinase
MIRRLKGKFLVVILGILILVFMIFVVSINLISAFSNRKQAREFLQAMAKMDGIRPPDFEEQPDFPPPQNLPQDNPVFLLMNFYGARLDHNNHPIRFINEHSTLYSEKEIEVLIKQVLAADQTFDSIAEQFYLVETKEYGKLVLFMDNRVGAANASRLLQISLLISGVSIIFLYMVSMLLTHWMLKPVQETFDHQKQFISDASHELKTPLSVIAANADVLEREQGQSKWLGYIKAEIMRMNKLVEQFLTLAKLEDQQAALVFSEVNFGECILSVLLPFESRAFEENIDLCYEVSQSCFVKGDEDSLKQLAAILIENAFKYCEQNGTIKVELLQTGNSVQFFVFNTGKWISEDEKKLIFQRFYRADRSRSSKKGSYGLGLSIADAIVKNHRGVIWVESEEGYGTKFIVQLTCW